MSSTISPFAFSAMAGVENANAPPDQVMEEMAAGAFRSLCQHLQVRSDQVQNMDLMTISGFCRNCLAKVCVGTDYGYAILHSMAMASLLITPNITT